MECPVCKHEWSRSRARNKSDTNNGGSSLTDAVIDSATNMAATAKSSSVNNDNSHPTSDPRTSSAPGIHDKSVTPLSAALEAFQSRSIERRRDNESASDNYGYQPRGQSQVDHKYVGNDDVEEHKYYENGMETYGSSREEEDRYEYIDDHDDEDLDDDYEDLQEEQEDDDDDDDWEEYVD